MTAELKPSTPITQENVALLKAGDWLILRGKLVQFKEPWTTLRGTPGIRHHDGSDLAHKFTYIGPDLGDGWIGAPEGGWPQSPVPRMFVEWQNADLDEGKCWSDELSWMDKWPVVAFRPALAKPAEGEVQQPALTVWYGKMPESNGRENWTAIIGRKDAEGFDLHAEGFCFARSEYPGRVLYEADEMRWIIGERAERPDILDYDADAHSGYVKPTPTPPSVDWSVVGPKLVEAAKIAEVHCRHALALMLVEGSADQIAKATRQLSFVEAALAAAQPEGK